MSGAPGSYPRGQRIAVVGAGISGPWQSAYLLSRRHNITLFEAGNYLGGHTNTVDVELGRSCHPVDTGFLVFNGRTYPDLIALFAELGVTATQAICRSRCRWTRADWVRAGSNLNTVFAQRRNLVSPSFLSMLQGYRALQWRAAERNLVMATQSGCSVGELPATVAAMAILSARTACCRWPPQSGPVPLRISCAFRRRPSCASA
ncbi:NAD(P)-binding protein [Cupriavidus basilensis]